MEETLYKWLMTGNTLLAVFTGMNWAKRSFVFSNMRVLFLCCFFSFTAVSITLGNEGWPEVFNPYRIQTLHFELNTNDWETLKQDTNTSFPEQVFRTPALMWANGETNKLLVQIRQGKDDPIPSFENPQKVGLKVDINDLVPGQEWHGLKKLSLENGNGGSGVLREGVAMNLHRLASEYGIYDYPSGYATWVRVIVNETYQGLYSLPEQRDKQFLRNRGMYKPCAVWLYEYNTLPILDTTVATNNSPTFDALCFPPFNDLCPQPSNPDVALGMESTLEEWVDMRALLTLAAIESFIAYGDGLFTKGNKNVFATDFHPAMQQKRKYFAWDLDSGFSDTDWDIYSGGPGQQANRKYQTEILGHYWFRDVYRHVYSDLLNGPLSLPVLNRFIDELEAALTPYIEEDPYLEESGEFDAVRQFFTNRIMSVRSQIGVLTAPPVFNQNGGEIISGFQLSLSHTNATGTIYYALDGSDPRALGGAIQGIPYTEPLTLTNSTHITCRVLSETNWSALRQETFSIAAQAGSIKITEIMYNPLPSPAGTDAGDYEFIELKNTGTSPVNLSGCFFSGIGYMFAPGTMVDPGEILVLVKHPLAFAERYPGIVFHGVYWGGLSGTGEKIRLKDANGNNIFSVEYDDDPPWDQGANGFGHSLVNLNPDGDPDHPDHWRASTAIHGSPGADDPAPPYQTGVVINEILAHTDPPLEDAIELYNPTTNDIDIGGWYLSDHMDLLDSARALLRKYRIPENTIIPAGGYKVFYEADFNPGITNSNALVAFALSSLGEEVWLSSADESGDLTGHIVGFRFGATDNGVSMGRHPTHAGTDIAMLESHSFGVSDPASAADFRTGMGAANAIPRQGPLIISELMYHPAEGDQEFVELYNISPDPVDMAGWTLGGADYVFPSNSLIEPNELLVLLATTNISVEAFRAAQQVPANVPVLQHAFDLQNSGESLELSKPNDSLLDPAILVDRVRYNDRSPWPTEADGQGPSLEQVFPFRYSNDPQNWRTVVHGGTPGRMGIFTSGIAITTNSTWKHSAYGNNPGTAWRSPDYIDSGWASGDGDFGLAEAPDDSKLTFIPTITAPVTTYFRKDFIINDEPGLLTQLELHADYNDGFVAYINGQEVARRSMPPGPPEPDTLAYPHAGGTVETIDLLPYTNTLVKGGNLLAVELHQAAIMDADLIWNARLTYQTGPSGNALRISAIDWEPGGNLILEWNSISGQTYYVQSSEDLLSWTNASSPLEAVSAASQHIHPVSPEASNGFYRIMSPE